METITFISLLTVVTNSNDLVTAVTMLFPNQVHTTFAVVAVCSLGHGTVQTDPHTPILDWLAGSGGKGSECGHARLTHTPSISHIGYCFLATVHPDYYSVK